MQSFSVANLVSSAEGHATRKPIQAGGALNGRRSRALEMPLPESEPPASTIQTTRSNFAVPPSSQQAKKHRNLVTQSEVMQNLLDVLGRLAKTQVSVTLIGETGTGKDVLAHRLHDLSPRAGSPCVVFDCGAVPPNLAESELFGHERGSFTGAVGCRVGAFERAHKGTLFLDEVGELPLELQPRLLRALESRSVRRVGGSQPRPVDVRVVAATNRDLRDEVSAGRFRQDLYFRLAAAVVRVPPLRERPEDLPQLIQELISDLGQELSISEQAYAALCKHSWPGNVRELKNALACAAAFAQDRVLTEEHLHLSPAANGEHSLENLPLGGQTLQSIERIAIRQTLEQTSGNKAHAARVLGIAVSTLYDKLKRYELRGESA